MKAFILLATLACATAAPGLATYNTGFPFAFGSGLTYNAAPALGYGYSSIGAPAFGYSAIGAAPAFGYSSIAAPALQYSAAPAIQYAAAPAIIAPAFTKTQYHAQDELGQASYGYAHPGQAHSASRDAFGNVRGSYAYIDPTGKEVRTNYVADAGGFRVESNALPEAPVHVLPEPAALPVPVGETPEVAQARAEHLQAVEDAKVRNAAADAADSVTEVRTERKKRGITYAAAHPALTYATGYQYSALPALSYSSSYRYDAPAKKIAYVAAPLKTIAYTAAPLKTVTYAAAPLKTVTYAAAPLKTVYAAAPLKTVAYTAAPLKTIAYASPISAYGYSSYAPALTAYKYGYGYSPVAYSSGFSKILY